MNTPRAIEVIYSGIKFRSRTEARWAVFFDVAMARWRYEEEGYELPSGRYLPDFWLPDLNTWVEIKGQQPTERERDLCSELAVHTRKRVVLLVGPPSDLFATCNYDFPTPGLMFDAGGGGDCSYLPCTCPVCGRLGFEYEGRGERVCGKCVTDGSKYNTSDSMLIQCAAGASRTARFWDPPRLVRP